MTHLQLNSGMTFELTSVFKTLGNDTRLDIVSHILQKKEVSCQAIMKKFPLAQPTMSRHFNLLLSSGILTVRKNGVRHYYRVNKKKLTSLGVKVDKLERG